MKLKGKIAIVSFRGIGIGKACTLLFDKGASKVTLVGISKYKMLKTFFMI